MDTSLTGLTLLRDAFSGPVALEARRAKEIKSLLEAGIAGKDAPSILRGVFGGPRLQTSIVGGGVTVLPLHGFIMQRGPAWLAYYGIRTLESFLEAFDAAIADDDISHVVVHVDSPGGSVFGVPEAAARIRAARGKKDITTVCDPLMASAAYWIGAAAGPIAITQSGMGGSIGVIWIHFDFSKALEDAGVKATILTHGRRKAEGTELEPLGDEARDHMLQTCDDYGLLFDTAVAEYRGVAIEEVQPRFGEGAVFTADRCVSMGLADRVASLDDVLMELGVRRRSSGTDATAEPPKVGMAASLGEPLVPAAAIDVLEAIPRMPSSAYVLEPIAPAASASTNAPEIETTAAAGAAAAAPEPAPATGPTGQETAVDLTTAPQAEAGAPKIPTAAEGASAEKDRQRRIRDLSALHPQHVNGEQLDAYLQGSMSFEQVADDITKRAKASAKPGVTPARPEEEASANRPGTRVIRARGSARDNEPGFKFGMVGLALAAACRARKDGKTLDPAAFLDEGGYKDIATAMRSDRFDAGGAWVPENYLASEFIELLRPRSAVRSLNPMFVELTGGTASLPGLQGGATSYYKAEGSQGQKSEGTSRRVNLVSRELMTFVPITYQLLRRAAPDAAAMVRDDAVAASAQRSDLAFIRGDGTENSPKGMRYQSVSGNVIPANATVNLANVTTDLGKARLALLNANVTFRRPGWMMAPRTENYLMTVRDGNGNYAFRAEMLLGKLWGYPYAVTTQIPINLGGGSDESEVYFADFADVVVGEEDTMQVDVFDQITYYDGSAWQSAAQNNEIVLRIVEHHDIGVRHPESVAVLTAVKWGA